MRKPDLKGLLKLGRYLRRVPRKEFQQDTWMTKTACGTKACIAGHAASLFPARFKKVVSHTEELENGRKSYYYDVVHRQTGSRGEDAFAAAFHINLTDAYKITDGGARWRTPKRAAQAIFNLVKRIRQNPKYHEQTDFV